MFSSEASEIKIVDKHISYFSYRNLKVLHATTYIIYDFQTFIQFQTNIFIDLLRDVFINTYETGTGT